jgi:site-specific DNA recombinase
LRDSTRASKSTSAETRRCAVYTRKSTSAGLEQSFNSLDAQREACVSYIRRQPGWAVLPERYDDGGFTGANIERPAFQRLLVDIEAGRVDVVVVYKVDRLSRSLLDFARVMERFSTSGSSFVSVTQNFSTADAMGRLTLNMLMSFAEFEREMIGERTRDKIAAARRKGKWTGGVVPLGYRVVDKRLVVDEVTAVVAREVFSLYLEHRSALAVVQILGERLRSTRRYRAVNGEVQEARAWTKADVLRILKNPIYCGLMHSHGTLHPAEHPALVDRETFEKVREILAGASRPCLDRGQNPDYILRGLLRCARCGSAFTPASTRKGKTEYRYYRCLKRDKEGRAACPSSPLPADAIESYVLERLREAVADGGLAQQVDPAMKRRMATRREDLLIERKELPAEIASLSSEGKRLGETMADLKESARRLVERRLQEIAEKLACLEARLSAVERETAALDLFEVETGWVTQVLADFISVWDVLTPENRGRLLRAVVQRVEVDEPANRVRIFMADLEAGLPGALPSRETEQEAMA